MKTANEYDENLEDLMDCYHYQSDLTKKLDGVSSLDFDQALINEIVLWKVNRYAPLSPGILAALNSLNNLEQGSHRDASLVIENLLHTPGVDLSMASAILRFKNPKVFQIIDRHAYRAVYGKKYPLYPSSSHNKKIKVYFDYIDKLILLSEAKNIEFEILDRVLYVFDKKYNGKL